MIAIVRRRVRSGRLCDFGCGHGKLLVEAASYFAVTGIDLSERMAVAARQRVPDAEVIVAPVTAAALPEADYDAVTMQSYLEHEQDPLVALAVARRALRPGGVLVVKVPNYQSWNRRLLGPHWCGFRFPDHCNYFTPHTLRLMVHRAGFEVLRSRPWDRLPTSDNMYLAATAPEAAGVDCRRAA
jgi:2-polyprenyl-3-methyl-5-hydroxy-6-metoxy-1,4-benzoquinol methylase